MINIRKGLMHSLQQTDKIGKVVSGAGIVAGMVVGFDARFAIIIFCKSECFVIR